MTRRRKAKRKLDDQWQEKENAKKRRKLSNSSEGKERASCEDDMERSIDITKTILSLTLYNRITYDKV